MILSLYFLVLFPIAHLFVSSNKFLYDSWHIFYFSIALVTILYLKHVTFHQLGFSKTNTAKSLVVGTLLGALPIIGVALLDGFLVKAGWSTSELLAGAELRNPDEMGVHTSIAGKIFTASVAPFIEQVFITGYVMNTLLAKEKTGRFVITGGMVFSLLNLKFSIGHLFLGMISAGLMRASGSIMVPALMHTGFVVAEILIMFNYPRLLTILVFLV